MQPVLQFLNKIYDALNKDQPEFTISILLDFNHTILIEKLKHCGFNGIAGLWFKNYLSDLK